MQSTFFHFCQQSRMIPDYFTICPEHKIAINLSITTSTWILEVFCKTKAEMLNLSHYLVSEPLQWRPSPDCTFIMQSNSIFVLIVYSKSLILQRSCRKPQDQKMCQQFINSFLFRELFWMSLYCLRRLTWTRSGAFLFLFLGEHLGSVY